MTTEEPLNGHLAVEHGHSRTHGSSFDILWNKLRRPKPGPSRPITRPSKSARSAVDIKGQHGLILLHEPSQVRVDFIFIHGLGGGSRKTWSYSPEPGIFWPKEWLPSEAGFEHVRIHSYGYNSDWISGKESRLTVHDFGQKLLADLSNSPHLRKDGNTPIVFIAHSMGGLVAKKAYLLATRDPAYKYIGQRVHTMYFLGTPHRGADSARLARLVRKSAGFRSKAFLNDLIPGSGTLDRINDEFRYVCEDVKLWSFFEAVPTRTALTSSFIVEKESATLGLPKEHIRYLDADHRHICKFDTPENPNYVVLQRAFLTTIKDIGADLSLPVPLQHPDEYESQMKKISSRLQVYRRPDVFLLATKEKQCPGTCQWLLEDGKFLEWMNNPISCREDFNAAQNPRMKLPSKVLWLNGGPGTGKSVAAGHAIRYLQSCNLDCSFYFFEHKDRVGLTVAACLRSLAFQMAESNLEIRRAVVSMAEDDVRVNHNDHHMIWTSVFVERIMKVEFTKLHFLVIDAMDECSSKGLRGLVSMLSTLCHTLPVRIFLTSRPDLQLGQLLPLEEAAYSEITTGEEGSMRDIELFVKDKCFLTSGTEPSQGLIRGILARCNGVFLWAELIVVNLEAAYSIEDKQDILQRIPAGMDAFFCHIVDSIAGSPSFKLVECILRWVACSPRPLRMEELTAATKLDINRTLMVTASQLESMTGHLVFVDNESRIHITHETILAFLVRERNGFWIDRTVGHGRLAAVCLTLLCSTEFEPPTRHQGGARSEPFNRSPLSDYAALSFSYHLSHGPPAADATLSLLDKFFKSNVLTWIDRLASSGNLGALELTARRLKTYLDQGLKRQSLDRVETQITAAWAADIHYIAAVFGSGLLASPSSIRSIIPHFCPRQSIIRQLFAKPTGRLRLEGSLEEVWDDRLTCYPFREDATAVACCARFLAIGLTNGEVRLHHVAGSHMLAAAGTLMHGERVQQLAFGRSSTLLVSCSSRKLMLWDVDASCRSSFPLLWSQNLDFTPSYVDFHPYERAITLANPEYSALLTFRAADGWKGEHVFLHTSSDPDSSDEDNQQSAWWTPAELIQLDPSHRLAALVYQDASIAIWNLDSVVKIGDIKKEDFEDMYDPSPALAVIFNPVSELELLAISYSGGDIVTCNPWTLERRSKHHLGVKIGILAASSDGSVLGGAADGGDIYLFLFETLQPLYRIDKLDAQLTIRNIKFSPNSLQFFDIRGQCCNVWQPFLLIPENSVSDNESWDPNEDVDISDLPVSCTSSSEREKVVTMITLAARGTILFAGRQDGTIDVCQLGTGNIIGQLELQGHLSPIAHTDWNDEKSSLLSVDGDGYCVVTRLSFSDEDTRVQEQLLLKHKERASIRQALLSPDAELFLICTDFGVRVIDLDENLRGEMASLSDSYWVRHPSNSAHLIAIQQNTAHLFEWRSLKRLSPLSGISLLAPELQFPVHEPNRLWVCGLRSGYLVQGSVWPQARTVGDIVALESSGITPEAEAVSLQVLQNDSLQVQSVLGCLKSSLYFLDTSGWVCSIDLRNLGQATHYTRHFFIPLTWRAPGTDAVIEIVSKTTLVLGRGEHLVVLHGFLDFEQKVKI